MITEEKFAASANRIGCSIAAVKAVSEVESGGNGFLPNREPMILFEPHIFWKQLRKKGIDPQMIVNLHPEYADILYPVWGSKPYGKYSAQHERLNRASKIDRDSALESASWGKFQIMGMNWHMCNVKSLQDFVNLMCTTEDTHLELFVDYVLTNHLDDELRNLDWAGFARGYNGAAYAKNKYDSKLEAAYNKYL
jgi:hypothetical protein